ncbi:MAG: GspE/PulE family protein [Candidatus Eremiobacteraeota bacterium]|nr:GspE/PulE family protein [Candidatus Eremiobacteraeota bacterium]
MLRRIPRALALRYDVLALCAEANQLIVAVPDLDVGDVVDRIRLATGMQVQLVQASRESIRAQLHRLYAGGIVDQLRLSRDNIDDAPAIRMLDRIYDDAVLAHASDLHFEPTSDGGRVRRRIDGILHEMLDLRPELFGQMLSRIKLLAGMDIADKRQPQDGRYSLEAHGRAIDARVSSMPTITGEKLVIRLLDHQTSIPSLEHLGMPARFLESYRRIIHAPHGFVLVCGPTGSGKTTTLYATLAERNVNSQNLCTIEDPVEIRISGISQVQVNSRAGLTFASALRSFLRQDPNVIMVGEMRDAETANVAVAAALSGQLVVTTLHSSDACRTLDRLLELGVERHSMSSGLTGILAQRLIRKLCMDCRKVQAVPPDSACSFALPAAATVYAARGCAQCAGTGYRGRTGIFEFLVITDQLRDAISEGASTAALGSLARTAGHAPMIVDGLEKVVAGITSLDELQRVLGAIEIS